jgi:hypothetical protein
MSFGGERSRKILAYALAQQAAQKAAQQAAAEDIAPTISPEEEEAILATTLPGLEPEPSFLRRNFIPLFVGGGALLLGSIGLFLMLR